MKTRLKVLESVRKRGRPTVREVAADAGIEVSTAHRHLRKLREEGKVTWEEGKSRTLRIAE